MSAEKSPRSEFCRLNAAQAAQMLRSRQISPVELVQALLARIEDLDCRLNCFLTVTADQALAQARRAEADLLRGETESGSPLGLLHGVPLALKDLFETRGVRTTSGSKFFSEYIPEQSARVVEKLEQAGVIWIGKTNLHEIALGLTSVNPHFGAVHNPWMLDRVAGGSSGGSAAALAARFCPAALGSDTGGSIRVPAALCGVAGLKPTFGRVSLRGVMPLSWNLDHAGPMARSVLDLALLLQIMAGYDPQDPYTANVPVDDYLVSIEAGVRNWKIALAEDDYFWKTSPEVCRIVGQAARVFEQLGAAVEPAAFPGAYEAALANGQMVIADAAALHSERIATRPQDFGDDVRERLRKGAALSLDDYIQARRTQTRVRRDFERFFERVDLLILPTTPITAPPIEGPDAIELAGLLTRYTAPFNLTGFPAVSIPCGVSSEGLPVGMQLIAPPWKEAKLLQAAYAFEQATDWHRMEPAL